MALKSIQLCHMDPHNRKASEFTVTVNNEGGNICATFYCTSERDARILRDAIREHSDGLLRVADYRS